MSKENETYYLDSFNSSSSIFDEQENDQVEIDVLNETLKKYRSILSSESFDYLKSLANLEISALSTDINVDDRNLLSELDIYRKLVFYNIYNRANNLLYKNKEFGNLKKDDRFINLSHIKIISEIDNKQIPIFDFNYSNFKNKIPYGYKVPSWYKNNGIGDINLYLTCENSELREKEIERLLRDYEFENSKKNPYNFNRNRIGGAASQWDFEHDAKLSRIQKRLNKLDKTKQINDFDKKVIEIQQYYYNLLLENMGIDKDYFEDVETEESFMDREMVDNMSTEKVIKYPNLKVYSNIKNL